MGTTTPVSSFEKRMKRKEEGTNKQTNKQTGDDDEEEEKERKGECDRERPASLGAMVFVKYM